MPEASAAGVIHDLGYRNYDGPRLGRAQIVRALTWHSFRSCWGFGRSLKSKIVPILAVVLLLLPAIINAFAVSQGQHRLVSYDVYSRQLRTLVPLIFLAAQAPELVSRDLRSRVLPLYFSRPIRAVDYPLAKYLALTGAMTILLELPLLVLYAGTIASAKNGHAVWLQTRELIPGLGVALIYALLLPAVGLLLASLSSRRAYATGIVAAALFLTFVAAQILIGVEGGITSVTTGARLGGLLSPFTLVDGVRVWLGGTTRGMVPLSLGGFGPAYGAVTLGLLLACLAGLVMRYRKVSRS